MSPPFFFLRFTTPSKSGRLALRGVAVGTSFLGWCLTFRLSSGVWCWGSLSGWWLALSSWGSGRPSCGWGGPFLLGVELALTSLGLGDILAVGLALPSRNDLFFNQMYAECYGFDTMSNGSTSPDLGDLWHHGHLVSPQWEGGLELDSASDCDNANAALLQHKTMLRRVVQRTTSVL